MRRTFNYKNVKYLFEDYDDDYNSPFGVDYGMHVKTLDSQQYEYAIFPGEQVLNYCDINCELNPVLCSKLIKENFN